MNWAEKNQSCPWSISSGVWEGGALQEWGAGPPSPRGRASNFLPKLAGVELTHCVSCVRPSGSMWRMWLAAGLQAAEAGALSCAGDWDMANRTERGVLGRLGVV